MSQIDPIAVLMREPISDLLDRLAVLADRRDDPLLRCAVEALQSVYGLYPEFDDMALRGTPQQQARAAIHNAIVAAVDAHYEALVQGGLPDSSVV